MKFKRVAQKEINLSSFIQTIVSDGEGHPEIIAIADDISKWDLKSIIGSVVRPKKSEGNK